MKFRSIAAVAGLLAIAAPGAWRGASAQASLYPASDAARDIDRAVSAAGKDGKHVLLDFGADWCPDCRVLGQLFEDPAVAPFAAANFHVVHVDVGRRDKNGDLIARYGATAGDWIPAVVVLDPGGKTVGLTDPAVRLTRRSTPQELLALLRQWAPTKRWLELSAFTERGVHVALALERDSGDGLWLSGTFTPTDADAHLYAMDLPPQGVNGLGRPTRVSLVTASGLEARGALVANRPVQDDRIEELRTTVRVYPAGAVTLRLPVALVDGGTGRAVVSVTYMACSPKGCLPPVIDKRVAVAVPGAPVLSRADRG